MLRPFSQPATKRTPQPKLGNLPIATMLARDRQLGVECPDPDAQ